MTKKELIAKLDELGGRVEDLRASLRRAENDLSEALDEMTFINDFINDQLPKESEEIDNDEEINKAEEE